MALVPKNKSREKKRIHAKRPFKIVVTTPQPKQKAWQPLRNHLTSSMVNLTRQKRYIFKVVSLIYEASHLPTIYNAKNIFGNENWGTLKTPEGGDLWKNKHNEVGFWSHAACGEEVLVKDIIYFPLSKSFLAKCTKTPLIELFSCWLMRQSKQWQA